MVTDTSLHRVARTEKASEHTPKNRVSKAYRELRDIIVHGRLAPGTRIIEADLATRLGVSRTPVRDALRVLQQQGLVVGSSAGGVKARLAVAPLTKEDAHELYEIIGRLEGLAANQIAQLAHSARTAIAGELLLLNDGLKGISQSGKRDANRFLELDMDFHRTIVEASARPRLLAMHASISSQTERYWRLYSTIVNELGNSIAEHDQIIRGIDGGDPEASELGIKLNWEHGWERLCAVIDTVGERGGW